MIWNPGQLPADWTLEKLMGKHASHPYNPDIANAFFRAGLIESWGRGIERIIEACQSNGYPAPEWQLEPGGLWVIFTFPAEHVRQLVGRIRQTTPPATPPVTPPVMVLLELLAREGELGSSGIRQRMQLKDRAHLREHYIDPALAQGLIEYTLPDKPTSPKQTYRITGAGLQLLAKIS